MTEQTLYHQQSEVLRLKANLNQHATMILSILVPGLLLGWKIGTENGVGNMMKLAAKFAIMDSLKHIEKKVISSSKL